MKMEKLKMMIKRSLSWAVALVAVILMSPVLVSCSSEEDDVLNPVTDEALADYTVMLYGVASGDMNTFLAYNLNQLEAYGYSEKVNFTAKIKFSASMQGVESMEGTRLLTMTADGMQNEKVAESNFRMDDPQNLADFIVSSRERFPAKKYVLVLWGSGRGFDIYDQPLEAGYAVDGKSRSSLRDENVLENGAQATLSIFELEEALKRTGEKLDLLYWNGSAFGSVEYAYQLRKHVNYILGSEGVMIGLGGHYAKFVHCLENNHDLVEAMRDYVAQLKEHLGGLWVDGEHDWSLGLSLMDLSHMDEVVQRVKVCADAFIGVRDSCEPGSMADLLFHYYLGTSDSKAPRFYSEGGRLFFLYNRSDNYIPVVDLYHLFHDMGDVLINGYMSTYAAQLRYSLDKLLLASMSLGTPAGRDYYLGIYYDDKQHFCLEQEGVEVSSVKELYKMLDFDKEVGWSRFLETNVHRKIKTVFREDGSATLVEITDEE